LTGQLILGGFVQQLVGAARFLETSNKGPFDGIPI
jgi:hypothetical protein